MPCSDYYFNVSGYSGLPGISIYFKLKMPGDRMVRVPGIKYPIMMRAGRADKITFREIFMRKEYAIDLPASIKPEFIIDGGANAGLHEYLLCKCLSSGTHTEHRAGHQ